MMMAITLAGCAAATPGHVPERGRQTSQASRILTPRSDPVGSFDARGRYTPSTNEKGLECRRLVGVIRIKLEELRAIAGDDDPTLVTRATRAGMAKAMAGETPRTEGDDRRKRVRARIEGLNQLLAEKGCPTVDLEAGSDAPSPQSPGKIKRRPPA